MSPFWRNLAITGVIAILAGAAGGWMGAESSAERNAQIPLLRQSVRDIVRNDLNLTADQDTQIQAIENRFFDRRTALRMQAAEGNLKLADALMHDMAFGREAHAAINSLEASLGDLQRATVMYVLEVRDVLTPEQQILYDRKVREALTAASP